MVTLDLPPEPRSATRARTLAREYLGAGCPPEAIETAALLVTELVTNAILHARTPMVVVVDHSPGRVFLAVRDGSDAQPIARDYAIDAATGRGIALIDELSTRWGVERSPSGKQVWCELRFPVSVGDHARGDEATT